MQVLDAVSNGTVEIGNTALYYYWGKNPAFTFATALPFGLNTRQQISWLLWGGGQDLVNDLLKEHNVYGIPTGSTGAQMGGWFRKEIKSTEDLKGLKMRIGEFAGTILAKLGCVPQQLAGGDIYPALEKGTIDAAEWVGPYDDEKLGFAKVAKYYYYPGWWEGTSQGHNIINIEKWNALPKNYQAAVDAASRDTFTWITGKYDAVNAPALKRLIVNGAILKGFPQEVLEACYTTANEIYADLSKTNPHFGKLHASMMAFKNNSLPWTQVAELSYDSFMARMRTRPETVIDARRGGNDESPGGRLPGLFGFGVREGLVGWAKRSVPTNVRCDPARDGGHGALRLCPPYGTCDRRSDPQF